MSGIYVKYLGMPNSCEECRFCVGNAANCSAMLRPISRGEKENKPFWCPIRRVHVIARELLVSGPAISVMKKDEAVDYIKNMLASGLADDIRPFMELKDENYNPVIDQYTFSGALCVVDTNLKD